MAEFGFDRLIYGFTHFWSGKSLGDPGDFILLSNHDREYTDVFVGEKGYMDAPMVNWALNNEGAGSWSMLAQMQAWVCLWSLSPSCIIIIHLISAKHYNSVTNQRLPHY